MPLFRRITGSNFEVAIWRIEEEQDFFESRISSHPEIQNENKRLQWYATRYLVGKLLGESVSIEKDGAGKPVTANPDNHISLSHTPVFATVMFSNEKPVGVDLEMINPKVLRIAHKFLREEEIRSITEDEKIERLILYWSAKESLYKLHGKGGIDFTTQLLIEPFELRLQGELKAQIIAGDLSVSNLKIYYDIFQDHVLTYVTGR